MILKNPSFINKDLKDGLYVLESTKNTINIDEEDHIIKSGVQIHKLEDILDDLEEGTVYIRKINMVRDDAFNKKFASIHNEVYNKPYDMNIFDWACARYNLDFKLPVKQSLQTKQQFWCSALVSYVYCELGLIQNNINWSIIAPRAFSSTSQDGDITFVCDIGNDTLYK